MIIIKHIYIYNLVHTTHFGITFIKHTQSQKIKSLVIDNDIYFNSFTLQIKNKIPRSPEQFQNLIKIVKRERQNLFNENYIHILVYLEAHTSLYHRPEKEMNHIRASICYLMNSSS